MGMLLVLRQSFISVIRFRTTYFNNRVLLVFYKNTFLVVNILNCYVSVAKRI